MRFASALNFFRRSVPPVQQDPADLGTCFGMEASLEDGDYRSSAPLPLESESPAVESPLAWLSRRAN
ncbi:MAG: hypothetical protein JO006_10355 [Paucibacter sp.]|nr:hypothetical protein [Roseateles sp.]